MVKVEVMVSTGETLWVGKTLELSVVWILSARFNPTVAEGDVVRVVFKVSVLVTL